MPQPLKQTLNMLGFAIWGVLLRKLEGLWGRRTGRKGIVEDGSNWPFGDVGM